MLALISAMPEELAAIVAMIDRERVVTIGSREFHVGTCHGHEVVCVVSRIGKVSAATTTAILLERFQPRAVVMTGLAGAVDPDLAVGDVVIADRLIQHDLDARPLFPRHEVPLLGVTAMPTDPDLRARLTRAAEGIEISPHLVKLLLNLVKEVREKKALVSQHIDGIRHYYGHLERLGLTEQDLLAYAIVLGRDLQAAV